MRFYRSLGRVWTGTQADARAAQGGSGFETIDVPTDKPALLAWLNSVDLRPGEAAPTPAPVATAQPGEPYQNGMPTRPFMGSRDPAAASTCPACGRQTPFA